MKEVIHRLKKSNWQFCAVTIAVAVAAFTISPAKAADESRWGNPCDTRDVCSADPIKHAALSESSPVKAREYVGEMHWGTGGAPDDVYVISKTVGSREFADTEVCEVRDACDAGQQAWKTVRVGPSGTKVPTAKQGNAQNVANTPIAK